MKIDRFLSGASVPTPYHLLGVAAGFVLCLTLSVLAFAAREPREVVFLAIANAAVLLVYRPGWKVVKNGGKLFLTQSLVVIGLYLWRFGWSQGLLPGFLISCRLLLAFLPGLVFLHATPQSALVRFFAHVLPDRSAFVLAMSLRFLPVLLREIRELYEAQILRGARILPGDLRKVRNWPDLVNALIVPSVVRILELAHDIALAARARGFDEGVRRSCWPGARRQAK